MGFANELSNIFTGIGQYYLCHKTLTHLYLVSWWKNCIKRKYVLTEYKYFEVRPNDISLWIDL